MYYKNKRLAREGDPVVLETVRGSGLFIVGTLHSISPGAAAYNGLVTHVIPGGIHNRTVTISEIYHAGDALNAVDAFTVHEEEQQAAKSATDATPAAEPAATPQG